MEEQNTQNKMKKDLQDRNLKETSVRSSPRLKALGAHLKESLHDEHVETECTSRCGYLYPESSTNQSAMSDRSMTQRELKKLEDYWTKNNPVQEGSPRLRCNRRLKSEAEECLNTSKRSLSRKELEYQCTASESPLTKRVSKHTPITFDDNIMSTNTAFKPKQIDFDNDAPKQKESNWEKHESIANSVKTTSDQSSKRKFLSSVGIVSPVESSLAPVSSPYLESSLLKSQSKDNDTDTASEEYIPPRKKLRSELTKDELWEGFPLTISFKRLAPLCKHEDQIYENNQIDNISEIQSYESIRSCVVETNPDMKTTNTDNHESIINSSVDRIGNCVHTTLHDALHTENKKEEMRDPIDNTKNVNENEKTEKTYVANKKNKSEQSKTPVKRSLRLQEKHSNTPRTIESIHYDTSECLKRDPKPIVDTFPKAEAENPKAVSQNMCNQVNADNINQSKTGVVPVTDCKKEVSYFGKEQILVGQSISEILSCGSNDSLSDKTSVYIAIEDQSTATEKQLKENQFLLKAQQHTCTSFAETKNMDSVNNELIDNQKPTCSLTKSLDSEICRTGTRDIATEQRRSSRIATLAKHLDNDGSALPRMPNDEIYRKVLHSTSKEETTNDYTESENNKQGQGSIKKKTVSKSVPPLKIKLKFPRKYLSKKETLPVKQPVSDLKYSKAKQRVSAKLNESLSLNKNKKKKNKKFSTENIGHGANCSTSNDEQINASTKKELKVTKVKKNHGARSKEDSSGCENRRHVQLSHARASPSKVDEILGRKWDNLPDKKKIKYYQRAKDACRDENRHSNRKAKDAEQPSTSSSCKESQNPSLVHFLTLDSKKQNEELKKRLHFFREVSPEEYNAVMNAYKESCLRLPELQYPNTKSKQKKSRRKAAGENKSEKSDNNLKYRKLLYEKINESWDRVEGIWKKKKGMQLKILNYKYKMLIKRLIRQEPVHFCKHTTSDRLSETIQDLKDLEREGKLNVSGGIYKTPDNEYDCQLRSLKDVAAVDTEPQLSDILPPDLACIDVSDLIQDEIPQETLSYMIEDLVKDMPSELLIPSPQQTWQKTSPTKFLNEMAIDYMQAPNGNVEYLSAVSLLSKKEVYSQPLQNTQCNDANTYTNLEAKRPSTPKNMNNSSSYNP